MSSSSLFSKLRKNPRSPLDDMPFTSAGTFNVPVEIWREIFNNAAAVDSSILDIDLVSPATHTRLFKCEHPAFLPDYYANVNPHPFNTRLSLTMVCRSWYLIANSILWSHILVDSSRDLAVTTGLYQTLKHNHSLSSYVFGITVNTVGWFDYPSTKEGLQKRSSFLNLLRKIIGVLPPLRMISCPHHIAGQENWDIRPQIVILTENQDEVWRIGSPPIYENRFWHHSKTLVLTYAGIIRAHSMNVKLDPQIFPNLVNLAIGVVHTKDIISITTTSSFPSLRNLSIKSHMVLEWSQLLQKLRTNLENLELLVHSNGISLPNVPPPIIMPRLKGLCLLMLTDRSTVDVVQWWMSHIQAPRLHRI